MLILAFQVIMQPPKDTFEIGIFSPRFSSLYPQIALFQILEHYATKLS